jgi:hypothetical protein
VRRQTSVSEWLIGIGVTLLAVLAALALLAPASWRRAFEERDLPLRTVDEGWVGIGPTNAPLQAFLRFATHQAIYDQAGNWRGALEPGLVSARSGHYRFSREPNTFAIWFARQPEGPWLPVGGGRRVQGLVQTARGVLAWGENVGLVHETTAVWREWPRGFKPLGVASLSSGGYLAWDDRTLYVARTFNETPVGMQSPGPLTGVLEGIDEPRVLWLVQGEKARRFRLR